MNFKRYLGAAALLFLFIFLYEGVVHGVILSSIYAETEHLWRSEKAMMALMPFRIMTQGVIALWLAYIFAKLFPNGGVRNGVRFGLYLGGWSAIQAMSSYLWLPISLELAALWFVVYLVESVAGGLILGFMYT